MGCAFVDGNNGAHCGNLNGVLVLNSVFRNQAADAIVTSGGGRFLFIGNSIYSPGGDGISIDTTIPLVAVIANNIFSECAGAGITNTTGTNTANVIRMHNLFHGNGSTESGFGDTPSLAEQIDSSSPFISSTDMAIVTGSNAIANGLPKEFENESYTSFLDIGAVQREEPAGGGGNTYSRGRIVNR